MKRLMLLLSGNEPVIVPIENKEDVCSLEKFRKDMSENGIVETFIDDSTTLYVFSSKDCFNLARLHWNTLQMIERGLSVL